MEDDEDPAIAAYNTRLATDYKRLVTAARGKEPAEAERAVREFAASRHLRVRPVDVAVLARTLSDERWLWKHPLAALVLAWRHRTVNPPRRTLRSLVQPRISG